MHRVGNIFAFTGYDCHLARDTRDIWQTAFSNIHTLYRMLGVLSLTQLK